MDETFYAELFSNAPIPEENSFFTTFLMTLILFLWGPGAPDLD